MAEIDLLKLEQQIIKLPKKYPFRTLADVLRTTEEFKKCLIEYDSYIKDVAGLIRTFGFKSSKDVVAYLHLLLASGHFSKNHFHIYKIFKYEKTEIMEICGARVLSGESVCRHQSAFMVDVLNELGYSAAIISCLATSDNPITESRNKVKQWNHAVVGISENSRMYLFDPTNGLYSGLPTHISKQDAIKNRICQYISTRPNFLLINPNSDFINVKDNQPVLTILDSFPMTLTSEDVRFSKSKAELIYQGSTKKQYSFYEKNSERIKEIERMYGELIPHSDKKIKSWKIHQ